VEARTLSVLVDAVLPRMRRESVWHGEEHWRCVTATGLSLGSATPDVDRILVFCFGLLHDTRRENEAIEPGHGSRAAAFAMELRAEGVLRRDDARFGSLAEALQLHSAGRVSRDPTIGTCWYADRLHLHAPRSSPILRCSRPRLRIALGACRRPRRCGSRARRRWEALVALVGDV
jgi:hypothetical protein